jgi:predicted acylesterase/phospholipase RssA
LIPENSLKRQFLFYKANTIWGILIRFLKGQDILDGQALIKAVREFCGDLTFKEIHDNYKWNLNITVTDHINATNSRLLNYLTSPNVIIWSAAAASSAIPYIFEPQELMVKTINGDIIPYRPTNRETRYLDGSIGGDLPM